MIALVRQQNWNYISVVYEDDFYGVRGFTGEKSIEYRVILAKFIFEEFLKSNLYFYSEIKKLAASQGVCIATSQAVPRNPTQTDFLNIVINLMGKKAKGEVETVA